MNSITDDCIKHIRTWADAEKDITAVLEKHGIERGHAALFLSRCSASILVNNSPADEVEQDALAVAAAFVEFVKLSRPDSAEQKRRLAHPAQQPHSH